MRRIPKDWKPWVDLCRKVGNSNKPDFYKTVSEIGMMAEKAHSDRRGRIYLKAVDRVAMIAMEVVNEGRFPCTDYCGTCLEWFEEYKWLYKLCPKEWKA